MYDILILGGGPAGLSAAVAARQKNRTALVIGNPSASNPLWRAERIDNYPGLPGVTGAQLLEQFERHARDMGVEFVAGRAISAMAMGEESFFLTVGNAVYEGRKLILAAGVTRGAKYPGEQEYLGRGVSYCATCDGSIETGRWLWWGGARMRRWRPTIWRRWAARSPMSHLRHPALWTSAFHLSGPIDWKSQGRTPSRRLWPTGQSCPATQCSFSVSPWHPQSCSRSWPRKTELWWWIGRCAPISPACLPPEIVPENRSRSPRRSEKGLLPPSARRMS